MVQTPNSSLTTSMSPQADVCRNNNNVVSIPYDVIQTNIITRLDGPTLAAAGCSSSELHALVASEQFLWEKICYAEWPSTSDPRVSDVISTFRSGFRSFFSDSYPLIHYDAQRQKNRNNYPVPRTSGLISAVDIYYKGAPIFSKVVEMEVEKELFMCSPLRVDLLDAKEFVHPWIQDEEDDVLLKELEENVTLSWILINPERKRAVNLSSQHAVMAQRHWLTGEVQLKFAMVLGGGEPGTEKEHVECGVVVTCAAGSGAAAEVVHAREVCMGVEDMEGRALSGRDSLVILLGAMERGERRGRKGINVGEEGKKRFEEFTKRKEDWRMMKRSKEKVLDLVSVLGGLLVVLAFWLWLFGVFF